MGKPEDSDFIAWIDLECTGNQPHHQIIEVGLAVTDRELELVETQSWVIKPSEVWEYAMNDLVREMHTENGLIRDVNFHGLSASYVDASIANFLYALDNGNHIPFAGSGVSHYDRRYIQKDLPLTDQRLSYWALDVGVLRRTLAVVCGISLPSAELKAAKSHRALDDILVHIEEMKVYRDWIIELTERPTHG